MTLKNFKVESNMGTQNGLNLYWSYKTAEGMRKIYEVPQDIVNTMTHDKPTDGDSLAKHVVLGTKDGEPLLKVTNE